MAVTDEEVRSPDDIEIVKLKVKKGNVIFKGSVLALYVNHGDEKKQSKKLKANCSGIISQINVEEGNAVKKNDIILVIQPQTENVCTHPTIMKDMCAECGADLRRDNGVAGDRKESVSASVAMVHSIPELIVSQEVTLELGKEDEIRLLKQRKLVLLVDLDQTLIHTTNDNIPPNLKDVKHFQLWHGKGMMWYHTRFRPFTMQFLETVSKMYELHICTFGVRLYAHTIARFLDPEEKYFSHRILSRDECFDALSKTANLKALFPCGDKMVGIIDDREDVWNFAPNLIHVKPYRYFQGTADINAPPGLTKSEHDNEPVSHKVVAHSDEPSKVQPKQADDGGDSLEKSSETGVTGDLKSEPVLDKDKSEASEEQTISTDSQNVVSNGGKGGNEPAEKAILETEHGVTAKALSIISGGSQKDNPLAHSSSATSSQANTPDSHTGDLQSSTKPVLNTGTSDPPGSHTGELKPSTEPVLDTGTSEPPGSHTGEVNDSVITNDLVQRCDSSSKDGAEQSQKEKAEELTEEIEWDDEDDYLLHLEEILTRVHKAYYDMYEQSQSKGSSKLPDLKNIIPYVRKKVLKGANIVFSGMFPLNMPAEQSRAYTVAVALGANVQNDIIPRKSKSGKNPDATTHLVAAKPGTGKHKSALKAKGIHVVTGDWLWACNERWEWVEESLFQLSSKDSSAKSVPSPEGSTLAKKNSNLKRRKPNEDIGEDCDVFETGGENIKNNGSNKKQKLGEEETASSSTGQPGTEITVDNDDVTPEKSTDGNFASSFNPLYSFSDEDIEFMDKEVDEIMDEDDDSSEESDTERETRVRGEVLGKSAESDSDSESLSGDFPRGWKLRRKSFSPNKKEEVDDVEKKTDAEDDDETENELDRYQNNIAAFVGEDSQSESSEGDDSIGSVDDEIAEAVEKEFLGT
ncbi:unnamed protein product [Lymnaea stagnalis]|uniref:RNA polymerase II subunit A C-terminal domain phosphatase n=1 Tax=Lymnaea stagnalis TaxID=6523 RepID=A0AAV2H7D4_LYMST